MFFQSRRALSKCSSPLHGLLIIHQILLAIAVFAAPTPSPIVAGDVILAKPKHYNNPFAYQAKVGPHPAIALTDPDEHGNIKIATISHSHPGNPPTKHISDFNIKGLTDSKTDTPSTINVATPATVHVSKVKIAERVSKVEPHHLEALKSVIRKNCGNHVVRRGDDEHPDPCDREALARAAAQGKFPRPPSTEAQLNKPSRSEKKRLAKLKAAAAGHSNGTPSGGSAHHPASGPAGTRHMTPHKAHAGSSGSSHPQNEHAGSSSGNHHSNARAGSSGNAHHSNPHKPSKKASGSAHHTNSKKH